MCADPMNSFREDGHRLRDPAEHARISARLDEWTTEPKRPNPQVNLAKIPECAIRFLGTPLTKSIACGTIIESGGNETFREV